MKLGLLGFVATLLSAVSVEAQFPKIEKIDPSTLNGLTLLDDDTFEHRTQATTGSTTGDWFVCFVSATCYDCKPTIQKLEALSQTLKGEVNVAIVDSRSAMLTARRFDLMGMPHCVMLRDGLQVPFTHRRDVTVEELAEWAREGHREVLGQDIKPVQWFYYRYTHKTIQWLIENDLLTSKNIYMLIGGAVVLICGFFLAVAIATYCCCMKKSSKKSAKSKKVVEDLDNSTTDVKDAKEGKSGKSKKAGESKKQK